MNRLLARVNFFDQMLFNSDGGGAGAGGGDSSGAGDGAAAAASAGAAGAGDGAAAGAAGSGGNDGGAGAAAGASAGEIYKPEGIADHMLGKSNNETIDNMKKALDGYRERDAANKVPDAVDAYAKFEGDIPEAIKPHLETVLSDPLSARMQEFALKNRMSVPHYQGMVKEFLSVSAEMGLMEPIVDEKAEREALVPDVAKHLPEAEQQQAVERRMNENYAFLDSIAAAGAEKGGMAKDDIEFAKAMLGDSAKGHRMFEFMRRSMGGSGDNKPAMIFGGGAPNQDPRADLARRAALPENTWGDKGFNQQSYDQLQADYKKQIGD